ncbi:MAG: hypothetical protein A2X11_03660 [Bacteroidetes bacterium GWE2_42_24]|nr:MAG: hypothetical protein A2X11_03660 [Bacteroidetes bacterium GWE2_42_24]OFY32764.1 MAG: hypothetical protein A2X09_06460 [Bacteroidetes bacterium GWF2_43_11]
MKPKHIKQQRLESNRFAFTQIGLITALTLVLLAFEWESPIKPFTLKVTENPIFVDEVPVINTGVKPPAPPLPPPPPTTIFISTDDPSANTIDPVIDAETTPTASIDVFQPIPPPAYSEPDETIPFIIVEAMPEFPGGEQGRLEYLSSHIIYPQIARETHIQGTVYIGFVIEKDGSISNTEIKRGIGGGCDEEALRVIRSMPKWKPGHQLNKPVRVSLTMTVKFILK